MKFKKVSGNSLNRMWAYFKSSGRNGQKGINSLFASLDHGRNWLMKLLFRRLLRFLLSIKAVTICGVKERGLCRVQREFLFSEILFLLMRLWYLEIEERRCCCQREGESMELKTTLISEDSIALLCWRNGNA